MVGKALSVFVASLWLDDTELAGMCIVFIGYFRFMVFRTYGLAHGLRCYTLPSHA